jgi:hypothetical protein
VLRTAQDIFALDKAFFLIEGHPSRTMGRGYKINLETRICKGSCVEYPT